ncbi:MAG: hypothetical protein V3S10_00865 [Dehalococcoidales bacterium]
MHEQVAIKVNGFCDKGIQPLVSALNEMDGVATLDSCERSVFEEAYVYFEYGETWQELASLLQAMSAELSTRLVGCVHALRLEWSGSSERPRAQIVVEPQHVATLTGHLQSLATYLTASTNLSADDRRDIALRNWKASLDRLPKHDELPTTPAGGSTSATNMPSKTGQAEEHHQLHFPDKARPRVARRESPVR